MFRICQPVEEKASLSCTGRQKVTFVCNSKGESPTVYLWCSVLYNIFCCGIATQARNSLAHRITAVPKVTQLIKKSLVKLLSREKRKSEVFGREEFNYRNLHQLKVQLILFTDHYVSGITNKSYSVSSP